MSRLDIATLIVIVVTTLVWSILRRRLGPGDKGERLLVAGTLGGLSLGVLSAYPISSWIEADVSVMCAVLGMQVGWG